MPGIVVIGAGPGIGQAVATRFAKEGMPVALVARTPKTHAVTFTADVTDATALKMALDRTIEAHGVPEAVVYNAAVIKPDTAKDLTANELADTFKVNVGGALTAAAHLAPHMPRGSFLLTGGMPQPVPGYLSLSIGKAALRTLTTLLAAEYDHLHVATITIGGHVQPGTRYDPDEIAEHYWRLHTQPKSQWQQEIDL
jgi:NAD(P)-dependent dehydrogenase (short-subunit alcohol dehydrogenase family)